MDGVESVLAYYSRSLDQAEKNYCVTGREGASGSCKSYQTFSSLSAGKAVHSSYWSWWLIIFHSPEGQRARWLQQYDYQVKHKQGTKHNNADTLSRRPCARDICRQCDRLDQKEEHLRRGEAGLHVCCAMCIDARNLDDSECSGRWSKQELREAQEGGQRCAADSALEGEKWRTSDHPGRSLHLLAKLSSLTGHSGTASACAKEFFIACGRTRQATTLQSS